LPTQPPVQ